MNRILIKLRNIIIPTFVNSDEEPTLQEPHKTDISKPVGDCQVLSIPVKAPGSWFETKLAMGNLSQKVRKIMEESSETLELIEANTATMVKIENKALEELPSDEKYAFWAELAKDSRDHYRRTGDPSVKRCIEDFQVQQHYYKFELTNNEKYNYFLACFPQYHASSTVISKYLNGNNITAYDACCLLAGYDPVIIRSLNNIERQYKETADEIFEDLRSGFKHKFEVYKDQYLDIQHLSFWVKNRDKKFGSVFEGRVDSLAENNETLSFDMESLIKDMDITHSKFNYDLLTENEFKIQKNRIFCVMCLVIKAENTYLNKSEIRRIVQSYFRTDWDFTKKACERRLDKVDEDLTFERNLLKNFFKKTGDDFKLYWKDNIENIRKKFLNTEIPSSI